MGLRWEEAFSDAILPSMRGVVLRTSFVLGRTGGALPTLKRLVRFGLGGKAGNGQQGISWIHESDMNRLIAHALSNQDFEGMVIATAPNPVSNAQFMRTLRRAMGVPIGMPSLALLVRLGAPVIGTDPELVLCGRYIVSKRLDEEGFLFDYPELEAALEDLVS